jgi:hypothetical protein
LYSIVASVATATGRKPTVIFSASYARNAHSLHAVQVLGKPEPLLLELLMNANEPPLQPSRTLMVGDRSARPALMRCCAAYVLARKAAADTLRQDGQMSCVMHHPLLHTCTSCPLTRLYCLQDTDIQFGLAGGLKTLLVRGAHARFILAFSLHLCCLIRFLFRRS